MGSVEIDKASFGGGNLVGVLLPAPWGPVVGEVFSGDVVEEMLGSGVLAELRARDRVLVLVGDRGDWYPVWQFDVGGVRPVVEDIVAAFRVYDEGSDPLVVASWARTAQKGLGKLTPVEWLEAGSDVGVLVREARRAAACFYGGQPVG